MTQTQQSNRPAPVLNANPAGPDVYEFTYGDGRPWILINGNEIDSLVNVAATHGSVSCARPGVLSGIDWNQLSDSYYQLCFECHTVYGTVDDLIAAANDAHDGPPITSTAGLESCPVCLHDFLYPPEHEPAPETEEPDRS